VSRYQPGAVFAEAYVRRMCPSARITSRTNREDLASAVNAIVRRYAPAMAQTTSYDMGEVRFTCNGQAGYYFANTMLMDLGTNGVWHVDNILGYTAPLARAAVAEAVLQHMVRTYKQNPQWIEMQSNITMKTSRTVSDTGRQISETIARTFQDRWRREDNIFRKDTNARRGTTDLVDPDTGETWNVTGGKRYYWHKPGSDVIVGTDSTEPPAQGFERLTEY
jgi:hypothetical protein